MRCISILKIFAVPLVACSAYGALSAWNSLSALGQSADLIVVADAGSGRMVGPMMTFTLSVSRVLKGDSTAAGTSISVGWALPGGTQGPPASNPAATGNGLWFLKNSPSGWELLPVMQGGISFSQTFIASAAGPLPSAYAYSAAATLNDKIASEVSASVESANGGGAPLAGLQLGPLDQLNSPVIQILYQRMSISTSTNQRILGLSGLIRGGNAESLNAATGDAASFLATCPLEGGVLLQSVRDQFRASDPSSVTALGQAAVASANPSLAFREAAAHALASIHTVEALPYLATLLDDPDPDLRIEAIGGLSSFANGVTTQTSSGVPGLASLQLPATAPYKTPDTVANFAVGQVAISRNEDKYLLFWRNWWQQNRTALGY